MESPLSDPLALALFTHHRELASPSLTKRLPPAIVPGSKIKTEGPDFQKIKSEHRAKNNVIFLPTPKVVEAAPEIAERLCFAEPSVAMIIKQVAKFYRYSPIALIGERRDAKLVRARHVAVYLCREMTRKSLPRIGAIMVRDHTTMMHAARKIEFQLTQDERLRDEVEILKLRILDELNAEAA